MTPDPSILTHVQAVSPWVAALLILGYIIDRILKYLSTRNGDVQMVKVAEALTALTVKIDALTTSQSRFRDTLNEIESARNTGDVQAQNLMREQLKATDRVVKELVALKAAQGTQIMSLDESKLLLSYQWSWCRDEVSRIIVNSIDNNHFRGSEERVTRTVQRAWATAAGEALESIARFKSMNYPYQSLFQVLLPGFLDAIWKEAVPLYHSDRTRGEYVTRIESLQAMIKYTFDNGLDAYYKNVEDIDSGSIYNTLPQETVDEDKTNYRAQMLSAYKAGGRSPQSGEFDVEKYVREKRTEIFSTNTPSRQLKAIRLPPPTT